MRTILILLASVGAVIATPASHAQTVPVPPPAAAAPLPPIDPTRLAAATPVIDQIWPLGTYGRMMRGVMDQVVQGTMANMYRMKPSDFLPDKSAKPDAAEKTMGETMRAEDPYFQQRMDRSMKVMGEEMAKLMTEVEPEVRVGLAKAYARRFTVAELQDLQRFFATPTGRTYATESMMLMMSPDVMDTMQAFVPKMMQAMPAMMAKVEAATKDLPPPPKKKTAQ